MVRIKTYDDFIEARNKISKGRHTEDELKEIMKDYVLAPDFDKKSLLAHRVNLNNNLEYRFVWQLLENTLAQYKKNSDRLNFVEDCLRDFGTNNLKYYDSERPMAKFTGNDENIFSLKKYYPEYLVYMLVQVVTNLSQPKFKSLDAQIVWALLDHRGESYPTTTGQRFDADNELHQKLAGIAMQIEKQTDGSLFKGITERWNQDAGTQKARLEKAQDKAIRGDRYGVSDEIQEVEVLKQIKSGKKVPVDTILGLSEKNFRQIMPSDLAGLEFPDIYEIYTNGHSKATDEQNRAILELVIKCAPVDREWYKTISNFLVWGKPVHDYKLQSVFDKRFGGVAKDIMQDLENRKTKRDEQQQEYDRICKRRTQVDKAIKANTEIRDKVYAAQGNDNKLRSEFYNLRNSCSGAECAFYSKYLDLLESHKVSDLTEITGHPWKLFGGKKKKQRFNTAKDIFKQLKDLYQNPPTPWDAEEGTRLYEEEQKLTRDEDNARRDLEYAKLQYNNILPYGDSVNRFLEVMKKAREEHRRKIELATQKVSKRGALPKKTILTSVRKE